MEKTLKCSFPLCLGPTEKIVFYAVPLSKNVYGTPGLGLAWHLYPLCTHHQYPSMWPWEGDGKQEVKKMGSSLVVLLAQTDRKAINTSALAAVFTLSIHGRVLLGEWR